MTDTFVAPDTDDLDAFNSLMYGSAKPAEADVEDSSDDDFVEDDVLDDTPKDDDSINDNVEPEVDPEPEPVQPAKKQTAKERINELVGKQREAERQAEAERLERTNLQIKLAELEARLNSPAPVPTPVAPVATDNKPSPTAVNEDGTLKYPLGEFDPTYIADITRHTIETVTKENERKAEEARQAQAAQAANVQLETQWQGRLAEAEKAIPDLRTKGQDLVSTFASLPPDYGQFLAQTIMGLETGPEVLYHLANHLDEAKAIVDKGPLGAAIALGRLEARFAKSGEQTKPRVSAAPRPAPSTARGIAVGGQVAGDTDDLDAFSAAFFATRKRK
jgi:hypothetical protein